MTKYEAWLKERGVPYERGLSRGYAWQGVGMKDMLKAYERGEQPKLWMARDEGIKRFSFAIPDEKALQLIVAQGPILELGCGTGYWAHELRLLGCDVIAVDIAPYSCVNTKPEKLWSAAMAVDARQAVRDHGADRALLMVWPSIDKPWSHRALVAYEGSTVIHVGEWGGCTGTPELYDALDRDFEVVEEHAIPQWCAINDYMAVLRRKPK